MNIVFIALVVLSGLSLCLSVLVITLILVQARPESGWIDAIKTAMKPGGQPLYTAQSAMDFAGGTGSLNDLLMCSTSGNTDAGKLSPETGRQSYTKRGGWLTESKDLLVQASLSDKE